MKMKSFTPTPFKFLFLFVIAVSLFTGLKAEAMPEASKSLVNDYFKYCIYYDDLDLEAYYKDDLDHAYAGLVYAGEGMYEKDSNAYKDYTNNMAKEISAVRNRNPYTQEQAVNEIGRMIDNKKFAANYIFAKGQYKYTSGINAVLTKTNVNLRSQPNTQAHVLCVISGPREIDGGPTGDICSYMGEWTNPQGEHWVAVKYHHYEKGDLIGWLSGKYTQFITDAQVLEAARIYEKALAAPRRAVDEEPEPSYASSQPSHSSSGYVEEVSAEKLISDWKANQIRAERTYKGRTLRIRGKVDKVTSENGTPVVAFNDYPYVLCFVSRNDPLLADVDAGRYITVQGYALEINQLGIEAYKITNCQIISAN